MALKFDLLVPQGWTMDLAHIKDPVQAYETMASITQTAGKERMSFFAWEQRVAGKGILCR